jgi:hypothetical protein
MAALPSQWFARWLSQPVATPSPIAADPAALAAALQPGDVLLVDGKSRMSGIIKTLTQSSWSHAALYVGPRPDLGSVDGEVPDLIEADVSHGVRALSLAEYAHLHTRICRPLGLSEAQRAAVIGYAVARIGLHYDLKNVVDLARCLLCRSRCRPAAVLGANDPRRVICSSLLAQAFASVGVAVLPEIGIEAEQAHAPQEGLLQLPRHHSRISPRDFDISPNFGVIKPAARQDNARAATAAAPFAFGGAAVVPAR